MHHESNLVVYTLGVGYPLSPDGQTLDHWPHQVGYAPDRDHDPLYLSEGDTRNGSGSFFSAQQVLEPRWRNHLALAEALWLVPLLERMANGARVDRAEVFEAYRRMHGTLPTAETWHIW